MENHDLPDIDSDAKIMEQHLIEVGDAGLVAQFLEFQPKLLKDRKKQLFVVRNFGAVSSVELTLNSKSIIIGKNNSGKSTLAKLLHLLMNSDCHSKNFSFKDFKRKLDDLEINFLTDKSTIFLASKLGLILVSKSKLINIEFQYLGKETHEKISEFKNLLHSKITDRNIRKLGLLYGASQDKGIIQKLNKKTVTKIDKNFNATIEKAISALQTINLINSIYIPAERGLISILSQSLYSIISNKVSLPDFLKDFGSEFEIARKNIKDIDVKPLVSISYRYKDNQDRIYHSENDFILLSKAASGIRGIIPLYLVLVEYMDKPMASFIIEEPEINLHPTAQKGLVNFIAEATAGEGKSFITTTHSPYILSAFNNLIVAGTLAEENPALAQEIAAIIPQESWIKYDDVSAYVLENGTARSILDPEWKAIVADEIDSASEEIGREYDQLLALKYRDTPADE